MSKIVALLLTFLVVTCPTMAASAPTGKLAAEAAKIIGEAISRVEAGDRMSNHKLIAELRKEVAVVAQARASAESGNSFEYLTGKLTLTKPTEVAGVTVTGGQINLYKIAYKVTRNVIVGGVVAKCWFDTECLRRVLHEALQNELKTQKTSD
jgi:hypothetical protein